MLIAAISYFYAKCFHKVVNGEATPHRHLGNNIQSNIGRAVERHLQDFL